MATTISIIAYSIYTLILIGTLIWYTQFIRKEEKDKKQLIKNGILTQARIIDVRHSKAEKLNHNILDDRMVLTQDNKYQIMIKYEHNIENEEGEQEKIVETMKLHLSLNNDHIEKRLYPVGSMIDIRYLPENPSVAILAKHLKEVEANKTIIVINVIALVSALCILSLLYFAGFSYNLNSSKSIAGFISAFLLYVFMLAGAVFVVFGAIFKIKEYIDYRKIQKKGVKTKGEILNTWQLNRGKGHATYHIKYTYPEIAPYSLESMVDYTLFYQIKDQKELEINYLEEDKFISNIVKNKSVRSAFWLFILFTPLMIAFVAFMFYQFFLIQFS